MRAAARRTADWTRQLGAVVTGAKVLAVGGPQAGDPGAGGRPAAAGERVAPRGPGGGRENRGGGGQQPGGGRTTAPGGVGGRGGVRAGGGGGRGPRGGLPAPPGGACPGFPAGTVLAVER